MTQTINQEATKEVALVKTQATKAVSAATELTIKTDDDYNAATDVLSKIKKVARMTKERKEAITKPISEALASARDLFKPIEASCAEAEAIIKRKMLDYQDEQQKVRDADAAKIQKRVEKGKMKEETGADKLAALPEVKTTAQGKVGVTSTRTITKYRVTDEMLIPREYLVPDMQLIIDAIKSGKTVPGAESYTEKVINAR